MLEEWRTVPLGEFCEFNNGVNADKDAYGSGIPFVNVLEIVENSHIELSDIPGRVELPEKTARKYSVQPGDILFNRTSETREEVGLASIYVGEEPVIFGGFVIRARMKSEVLDQRFAGYALRAPGVRKQIASSGQGAIRANISQKELSKVEIPVPSPKEQRAIADALSDVDALIDRLDALIAKKRNVKTATMQRLLTGQERLPGFEGEWETKPLTGIGNWKGGGTPSKRVEAYWKGNIPWVSPKDFRGSSISRTEDYITHQAVRKSSTSLIEEKSILIVIRSGVLRKTIPLAQNSVPVAINQDIKALTPHSSLSPGFVFYAIKHAVPELMRSSVKTGTTVESIDFRNLSSFYVPIPSPTEQKAIATILSDMDAEIAALEKRREKTKAVKTGMMQELLTGKTRLQEPAAVAS